MFLGSVVPNMGRRNIGVMNDNKPKSQQERELASKVLDFNLNVMRQGRTKPKSVEELQERFENYLIQCADAGLPPTVEGLALISGWCRSTFYDIANGKMCTQYTDTINNAKDYVCNYDASMAILGKINAPIYIFRSKNFYDMKDTQDIQVTPNVSKQVPENVEEIIDKLPERINSASE